LSSKILFLSLSIFNFTITNLDTQKNILWKPHWKNTERKS
jgi:hypothetical protein